MEELWGKKYNLVCIRRIKNNVTDYVKEKLLELYNHQNYKFINNSNIPVQRLCKDGLHLKLINWLITFTFNNELIKGEL